MIHSHPYVICLSLAFLLTSLFSAPTKGAVGPPPTAVDDYVEVPFSTHLVSVSYSDLTSNDTHAELGTVTLERPPIHGALVEHGGSFEFQPNDDFWAIGSDLLVYRLDTPHGTSFASLYFAAPKRSYTYVSDFGFEDSSELPSGATSGVSIEADDPLAGTGSLAIHVADPSTDVYGSIVLPDDPHQPGSGNPGEVDACAGGFASIIPSGTGEPKDAAGYLLLLGGAQADIHTAAVRVGITRGGSDLFVEVRDSSAGWQRSAILDRGNEIVRFDVSFAEQNDDLRALLRADGLAVRSPVVSFEESLPTHAHLGFFQPAGAGSTADLTYDLVHVGMEPSDAFPLIDTGKLLAADDFEDGTLDAWTAAHDSGLVTSSASASSGALGLGVTGLADGKSYVSFQTRPIGETSDPRFRRLTARSTVDFASLGLTANYPLAPIAVQSGDHPLFGDPAFRLLVIGGSGQPTLRLFAYDDGGYVSSGFVSVAAVPTLELQVGRADGPGLANGWARLWVDGLIAHEVFGLTNYERELRNVHFGAQGYLSSSASGTLRHDDATVTR